MPTNSDRPEKLEKSSHDTYIFCFLNASVDQASETGLQ
jgi:hypothetical protein